MKILQNLIAIELKKEEPKKTGAGVFIPPSKWGDRQDLAYIKQVPDIGGEGLYPYSVNDLVLINPYAVIDTPTADLKLIKPQDILAIWE